MSICSLTSSNEIDFGKIVDQPTALFLQIPDEKETRHTLASMVILQAYKELVAKANTYPDLALPRSGRPLFASSVYRCQGSEF